MGLCLHSLVPLIAFNSLGRASMRISASNSNAYSSAIPRSKKAVISTQVDLIAQENKPVRFTGNPSPKKGLVGRFMDTIKGWWNKFLSIFSAPKPPSESLAYEHLASVSKSLRTGNVTDEALKNLKKIQADLKDTNYFDLSLKAQFHLIGLIHAALKRSEPDVYEIGLAMAKRIGMSDEMIMRDSLTDV